MYAGEAGQGPDQEDPEVRKSPREKAEEQMFPPLALKVEIPLLSPNNSLKIPSPAAPD